MRGRIGAEQTVAMAGAGRRKLFGLLLVFGLFLEPLAAQEQPASTPHSQFAGAVATSEPNATAAASAVLAAGGNAVDAAVAAGFALAVCYPAAGNLGGGGFLLYRDPAGNAFFLDFREVAPLAAHPDFYREEDGALDGKASKLGWKAVAVPGSVPGMLHALEEWGRLDRDRILTAAIALAENGFALTERDFKKLNGAAGRALREDRLARELFFGEEGEVRPVGSRIVQPRLKRTLIEIQNRGTEAFRTGEIIEALLQASQAGGGALQADDFLNYRPQRREPHRIPWEDCLVLAAPPPSSGGIFLNQVLLSLERFPLRVWGFGDPRTVQVIGEASARAFADRNRWLGDPLGFDFDAGALVAGDYLQQRRRQISPWAFTRPQQLGGAQYLPEAEDTTHVSVVDGYGGAVSMTTTLNGNYGAKVMAPGGFLMNNEMDDFAAAPGVANQFGLIQGRYNAIRAGRRPLSSMSPVIVVRNRQVDAVVGSPGGSTILTTVMQVLLNRYVFRFGPEKSVRAPRFHRQDRPPWIQAENGRLSTRTEAALRSLGQRIRRRQPIGDVNAVFRVKSDGSRVEAWRAVADSRHAGGGEVVVKQAGSPAPESSPVPAVKN
ncbi:MAG: gamma-glutamyltransferase [Planctomycetota bacterium]|nr:MAG: gamma-glutamyltransferase [Planctomycetota bacterium]